jgi:hypothetical protein
MIGRSGMVGVNIPLYDFFAAASSRIPTLQGATLILTHLERCLVC